MWGDRICDDPSQLHYKRHDQEGLDVHWERKYIAGFDAAIFAAVAKEREACAVLCVECPTRYWETGGDLREQIAEAIRERGNPQQVTSESEGPR